MRHVSEVSLKQEVEKEEEEEEKKTGHEREEKSGDS